MTQLKQFARNILKVNIDKRVVNIELTTKNYAIKIKFFYDYHN